MPIITPSDVYDLLASGQGHVLCLDDGPGGESVLRVWNASYAAKPQVVTYEHVSEMAGPRRPDLDQVRALLPSLQEMVNEAGEE